MLRREFLTAGFALAVAPAAAAGRTSGVRLAASARAQLGVTTKYDPGYLRLPYPGGDVPRVTGVCADVIVRAARDGLGLDLQKLLHEDMAKNFAAYPQAWGMHGPDANIDQRRVLNLESFWRRQGAQIWANPGEKSDSFPRPVEVGDELTWLLDGRLPHVGIVVSAGVLGDRIVHNIGSGVEEIYLWRMHGQRAKGHFRWPVA